MASAVPHVHFDTGDYPAAERFDIWRSAIATHQISRPDHDGEPFCAVVDAWTLGDLVLTHSRIDAARMARTEEMVRQDGRDWIQIVLLRSGAVDFDVGDGFPVQTLRPGELAIFDALRPLTTEGSAADCITCTVSRRPFIKAGFDPYLSHGKLIDGAFGRLVADFLTSLVRQMPDMQAEEIEAVPLAFVALLVSTLRARGTDKERKTARSVASLRRRAEIHIEENLTSQRLDRKSLAKDLAASEASLYRAFSDQGGVTNYVRRRRLENVHARLTAVSREAEHTISGIGRDYGFTSPAHFSRAFKKQYGFSPRWAKLVRREPVWCRDVDTVTLFRTWEDLLR